MPVKGYVDIGVIVVKINEMPTWQWMERLSNYTHSLVFEPSSIHGNHKAHYM